MAGKLSILPGIGEVPDIPKIPMLANGGSFLRGQAIVGEAGPELVSSVGGLTKITPLSQGEKARGISGSLDGGATIVNNWTINATIRENAVIDHITREIDSCPLLVNPLAFAHSSTSRMLFV